VRPGAGLIRALLLAVYAASGALALVYEIAWTRRLGLVFGSSHLAATTALVSFIGGLALGARLFARPSESAANPLRTYAWLEIAVGAFGVASPWILDGVQALYLATYPEETGAGLAFILWRFAIVGLTLAVPTALMGATVPVMTRVFRGLVDRGPAAFGLPLGANTAGALAGTMLSGFVLLPHLGLRTTLLLAGAANLVLGAVAWTLARRLPPPAAPPMPPRETALRGIMVDAQTRRERRVALLIAGVTGACGLGLEIAWTRLLALVLGSTTYAFTLMLSAYLLGLAIGSLASARLASTVRSPARALAWLLVAFAASTWLGLACANELPFWFLDLFRRMGAKPSLVLLAQGIIAAAIMVVPAIASGSVLPVVMRMLGLAGPAGTVGGRIYAVNTAAGIVAVILFTFVLIPSASLRVTMMIAVAVLALAAVLVVLVEQASIVRKLGPLASAAAILAAAFLATPAFRPSLFATAVYRYADRYQHLSRAEFEAVRNPGSSPVLYDEDGFVARVTVVGPRSDPSLLLDGKGASAGGDIPTEILLAQLPILLAESPRRVLVIGHGAGVTARSALAHDDVEDVVSIELERKVLECAPFFRAPDAPVAPDPRLRLVENDGRNFLLATRSTFDVICSQPSNPWVSGAAPLFTAEAYRAGARKLAPGGVFCQWLQTYEMSEENLRVLVRTFAREFPHVALFSSSVKGNVFMIGSARDIRLDQRRLESIARGRLGVEMRRARVEAPVHVLALFELRDADLRAFAGDGVLNTDDNAYIEFALPFDLFTNHVEALHQALNRASRGLPAIVAFPAGTAPEAEAGQWQDWAVGLKSMKRDELSREAWEEARKPR
jgi:spermidine synthase